MRTDLPAADGTGNSERQETADAAASEEAGQANLLAVTRRNLTLDIIVPHRVQISVTGVLKPRLTCREEAISSFQVAHALNMSRKR